MGGDRDGSGQKFFDDARGSAIECAACLDASVAKGFVFLERIQSGKEMLVRIVAMLTRLIVRFDPEQYRVRESATGLAAPFEDEHEDECQGKQSYSRENPREKTRNPTL